MSCSATFSVAMAFLLIGKVRLTTFLARSALRALLNAAELMAPMLFEFLSPIMHRLEPLGLQLIQPLLALLSHGNDADFAKHPQMLRDRRLWNSQAHNQSTNGQCPFVGEDVDDLSPPGLGNGVKHIGSRRSARHATFIFPYE